MWKTPFNLALNIYIWISYSPLSLLHILLLWDKGNSYMILFPNDRWLPLIMGDTITKEQLSTIHSPKSQTYQSLQSCLLNRSVLFGN